ncbi:hypothetical protein KPP23_060 [Pseudomonas phage KPP23]|nr:hypothetical protein KPP23_060 [Pseudomonas phage KPP23]
MTAQASIRVQKTLEALLVSNIGRYDTYRQAFSDLSQVIANASSVAEIRDSLEALQNRLADRLSDISRQNTVALDVINASTFADEDPE